MLLLATLACSCEFPFNIDDISEPRFMIECVPVPADESFALKLSYADPAYGERLKELHDFDISRLSISVNGKELDTRPLSWERQGNTIRTSVRPILQPGNEFSVKYNAPGLPAASASTVIPEAPRVSGISIVPSDGKEDGKARRVTVKMARPVEDGEYYGIQITVREEIVTATMESIMPPVVKLDTTVTEYSPTPGQMATMADLNNLDLDAFASVRYEYGKLVNDTGDYYPHKQITLLSSRQFDGDTYSFIVNSDASFFDIFSGMTDTDIPDTDVPGETPDIPVEPGEPETPQPVPVSAKTWYEVDMFRLSDELYNYCKSQYLMNFNMLSNFGVTPPNFTYSNVLGGIGIVGALSRIASGPIPDPEDTSI